MREVFQKELAEVQSGLVTTAEYVLTAIQRATKAFTESDISLADTVISDDAVIDEKTLEIDDLAIEILVRQAPVARDLRFIIATLRISSSLERMGDLAAHIAQLARLRFPEAVGPNSLQERFEEMGKLNVEAATLLVTLIRDEDEAIIDALRRIDAQVDEIHREVLGTLTALPAQTDGAQVVDATLANRYFERFTDHAVSVAQRMQYLLSGEWTQNDADPAF